MAETTTELIDKLKGHIDGGLAAMVKQYNLAAQDERFSKMEKAIADGLDEIRQRVSRGEKLDHNESGVMIRRDGRMQMTVTDDCASFLVRAFRKDPEVYKVCRELGSATGTTGGYTIPKEYIAELLKLVWGYGEARQTFRVVTMSEPEQHWPRLDGDMTVSWIQENTAGTEAEPTFGEVVLNAKKLMALTHVPSELLDDSEIAIGQVIADSIARAFAKEEDRVSFVATGVAGDGGFTGLCNRTDTGINKINFANTKTNATDFTPDHVLDALNAMPRQGLVGAELLLHRSMLNVLRRAKSAGSGEYFFQPPLGGEPGYIWGVPFRTVEQMPTAATTGTSKTVAVLTNAKSTCFFGDRKTVDFRTSEQFAFNKDQTFIRAIERIAVAPAVLPTGIVLIQTATA